MTRIALLRHYPTKWNREMRLQGQTDIPLTAEARATLASLRLPPEWVGARLVTSGLSRAVETARLLAPDAETAATVACDPRLKEISWGAWEGRRASDLLADPQSGFIPTGDLGWEDRPPDGESMADAWARVRPALADIASGGTAVLVTHKAIMRVILAVAHSESHDRGRVSQEARLGDISIKRGRLYPLTLEESGMPTNPEEPDRLVAR